MSQHPTTMAARRRRHAAALAGSLLAMTVAAAVGASPAAAAVDGVHRVDSPPSAFDSSQRKSIRAFCPAGERVIGGGAQIRSVSNRIALTEVRPDRGIIDSYVVSAAETPNR